MPHVAGFDGELLQIELEKLRRTEAFVMYVLNLSFTDS